MENPTPRKVAKSSFLNSFLQQVALPNCLNISVISQVKSRKAIDNTTPVCFCRNRMHMKATFPAPTNRKSSPMSARHGFVLGMTFLAAVSFSSLTARAEIEIAPDFPVNPAKELLPAHKDAAELLKSYLRDVRPENAGLSVEEPAQRQLKVSLAR
jgi:hypothetical protein